MRIPSTRLMTVALVGAAVSLIAEAADLVKPDIKPGLWEVTSHPQISGQMPIPEEELAKLTPERRAKVEAAMQSSMASAAKPRNYKECMTPEKIAKGFETADPREGGACKKNVITSSSSELQLREECSRPDGKTTVDVHFQISGGVRMTGTINAVMTAGSRTMNMNSKLEGKWLGSSCGNVKDAEEEK